MKADEDIDNGNGEQYIPSIIPGSKQHVDEDEVLKCDVGNKSNNRKDNVDKVYDKQNSGDPSYGIPPLMWSSILSSTINSQLNPMNIPRQQIWMPAIQNDQKLK